MVASDARHLAAWHDDAKLTAAFVAANWTQLADARDWLRWRLSDPAFESYLVLGPESTAIGVVWFQRWSNADPSISFAICEAWRNRGFGRRAVQAGLELSVRRGRRRLRALVLRTNAASRALVCSLGFTQGAARSGEIVEYRWQVQAWT
jgi:RimJ/RimL family protein N-acetyltransferase